MPSAAGTRGGITRRGVDRAWSVLRDPRRRAWYDRYGEVPDQRRVHPDERYVALLAASVLSSVFTFRTQTGQPFSCPAPSPVAPPR